MSMPAGWYDDGSGRQRWWDGQKWTDQFAAGGFAPQTSPQIPGGPHVTATSGRVAPVLGFAGLGLAVVGTVLACIPATFIAGVVVLIAAFVVSLVGLFKKNAAKWPSIVGMILAVVGGAIGTVVSLVIVAATLTGPVNPVAPTDTPPSTTSEEPSAPPTTSDLTGERPTPEEISVGIAALTRADGITDYDDMPEFFPCVARELYESDLSDDSLQLLAAAQDVTGPERDAVGAAIVEAGLICDPEGEGLKG